VRRACVSDMACMRARGGSLGEDKRAAGNECREGLRTKRERRITLTGWYKRRNEGEQAAAEDDLAHAGGSGGGAVGVREVSG
jgi:hypothetical protein